MESRADEPIQISTIIILASIDDDKKISSSCH
jgi:hypothetical protein